MIVIIPTDVGTPIVDGEGRPLQHFFQLLENIAKLEILDGSGSPEGVVEAGIKRQYLDTQNSVLYIKTTDGGNTGWVNLN